LKKCNASMKRLKPEEGYDHPGKKIANKEELTIGAH
jgi:hypothetical protein